MPHAITRYLLLVTICLISLAAAPTTKPSIKIIDRPLAQSSPRQAGVVIDHLVLHFCSDCIAHPDHPFDIDQQVKIFQTAKASANYLIDREGKVYRFVSEDRVAWHAGSGHLPWDQALKSMNAKSIGIEMFAVGSAADMKLFGISKEKYDEFKAKHPEWVGFSDAQYATLNKLIPAIRGRHPEIKFDRFHIIGHEEWAGRGRRTDPGELFEWEKIGLTRERATTQPAER